MNGLNRFIVSSALGMVSTACLGATTSDLFLTLKVSNSLFGYSQTVVFILDGMVSCKVTTDDADSEKVCVFTSDCSGYKEQCVQTKMKQGRHFIKADFGDFSITRAVAIDPKHAPVCTAGETNGSARIFFEC